MKEPAENVTLSSEEIEGLLAYVHQSNLPAAVAVRLEEIVRMCLWLVFALQESKITLKRLRSLLFGKHLKASPTLADASESSQAGGDETSASGGLDADTAGTAVTAGEAPPASSLSPEPVKPKGGHRAGTGRLGADAYVGAERIECRHEELAAGQRCPACGQGNLYELPPGVKIRIDGHALLSALRYELQKLRCSACGQIFTAPLPSETSPEKYSSRARAVLVVSRYYLGLPFYRIEAYQAMLGVPMPDSTQWDQIEAVADCCYVVFEYLESVAAQGEVIYQDDTTVRILSLLKANQQIRADAAAQGLSRPKERTGMYTTALVIRVGERLICLYYSGRSHAGENLAALLEQREAELEPPLAMSDALSRNEVKDGLVIRCHCMAHGRRQFSDLEETFPSECRVVLDVLKQVFDHDEEAREKQMSPQARLAYHQRYSQPLMDDLKDWLDLQLADHLVEDNSSLGQAIRYMQDHWKTLTRFLQIEGAPLDNNLVERALKLFIRQRKNSLFYKSEHSAYIASVLTSLIMTCIYAGVNVLDYFVASGVHLGDKQALFVDIGGGSTEITVGTQQHHRYLNSLKLGAIRLTAEQLPVGDGPVATADYERLQRYVHHNMVHMLRELRDYHIDLAIGSSGTIENLADVAARMYFKRDRQPDDVLSRVHLQQLLPVLCSLSLEERRKVPGLNPARADIIIAGAAILQTLMEALGVRSVRITDRGLRDGLLVDYLVRQDHAPLVEEMSVRKRSVLQFGRACQFNEDHARLTAQLALSLFDSGRAAELHRLGDWERELLEYAALLHHIGAFVTFSNYQAHTYYLIRNAELLGFDQTEIAIMATAALYHRKSPPRKKHPEFAALNKRSQQIVRRLAALLRLAECLDRSQAGHVSHACFEAISNKRARLNLQATQDCHIEVWGVEKHLDAFQKVFERRFEIQVEHAAGEAIHAADLQESFVFNGAF